MILFFKHILSFPVILILVGSLITLVGSFLIVIIEKEEKKIRLISIFTLIGGLCALFGGSWAGYQQDANKKYIQNKVQELYEETTGGDSYCYIHFYPLAGAKDIIRRSISVNGKQYPLHNIYIQIFHHEIMEEFIRSVQAHQEDPKKPLPPANWLEIVLEKIENIESLAPKTPGKQLRPIQTSPDSKRLKYDIFIFARGDKVWIQTVNLMRGADGYWTIAYRIKDKKGNIIHEKTIGDYPRNKEGKIDWW